MSDETYYLTATQEVENESADPMLWAKAETLAFGDIEKTRYEYIKLRVEKLKQENSTKSSQIKSNYFIRHFRGELSLPISYWVNGVIFNSAITAFVYSVGLTDISFNLFFSLYLLSLLLISFSLIGVWRSAHNYSIQAEIDNKKSKSWAILAQLGVFIGVIQTIPEIIDTYSLFKVYNSSYASEYSIQYQGTTDVLLTGYINIESANVVINEFTNSTQLNSLVLNSPGGLLDGAFLLADFIQNNNITVATDGQCLSACLLILASSNNSIAELNSELGFHQPQDLAEYISEAFIAGSAELDREYYDRFRSYGIADSTLSRYRQQEWTYLTLGEAFNDNIIDSIWDRKENQIFSPQVLCETTNCFTTPVSINNVNILDVTLQELSNEANSGLPAMIDDITRLDNTYVNNGQLVYEYTLEYLSTEVDSIILSNELKPGMVKNYCGKSDMLFFLENEVPLVHSYFGSDKLLISSITISSVDCN